MDKYKVEISTLTLKYLNILKILLIISKYLMDKDKVEISTLTLKYLNIFNILIFLKYY